jgi:hypothetical protein
MSLRFTKSEMAFDPPRLLAWQARLKFLLIASLAYAFLLSLLPNTDFLLQLISTFATEQESGAKISALLYHLRLAFSRPWLLFQPYSLPSNFGVIHVIDHRSILLFYIHVGSS